MPVRLRTYHRGDAVPALPGTNIFHSAELFHVFERLRGYEPVFVVAFTDSRPVARLLGVVRRSVRRFPPAVIKRCEVYGTGEYFDEKLNREELFGEMMEHLTHEALRKCFLIEWRNLENPLFGYRMFRKNGYFAVHWLRVRNSLHSMPPAERLSLSRKRQINKALKNGAEMKVAESEAEIKRFAHMLKKAYSSQVRKHFPDPAFFRLLASQDAGKETARVFLVKYKEKIIGGSLCLFSGNDAYLWFSGGMRKTYAFLYPGILAVWGPLCYAHDNGYDHLEFMDAGLPFRKHGYREFVLRFGGKQSSTRRWFRFRWAWLNSLLCRVFL